MTLVLRATRLADVSDRAAREIGSVRMRSGGVITDAFADTAARGWVNQSNFDQFLPVIPVLFNGSTWDRIRGDLSFSQIQKSLPWYSRRVPRRTIVMDDFEAATLKWNQAAGTVTRDTTTAAIFDGAASLKMVTGAAAGNNALASNYRGYMGLQKYVVELWWTMTAAAVTTPRRFGVTFQLMDGTNLHYLEVAYLKNLTTAQNKWQFSANGATYSDVSGGAEPLQVSTGVPYIWHYLRAHFNMSAATPNLDELHTDTLDLTGLTAAGAASANTNVELDILIGGTTDAAAAATYVVDDLVISDQEV